MDWVKQASRLPGFALRITLSAARRAWSRAATRRDHARAAHRQGQPGSSKMEDRAQHGIARVEAADKGDARAWKRGEAHAQPMHRYTQSPDSNGLSRWQAADGKSSPFVPSSPSSQAPSKLCLMSWNVDFMLPFANLRMQAAIDHLQRRVEDQRRERPDLVHVILLAECVDTDLRLLAANPWVQRNFLMTDTDVRYWESPVYGTTMLVDRVLEITQCFRVHFPQTKMSRDGLFIDIKMGEPAQTIRLCNTHLESLVANPPLRPLQMETCARFMHDSSIRAAVLAGDLNAIQPFDRTLHSDNGLKDAYLEQGHAEDDKEAGPTWGQQAATALRKRFGTTRMDKVFYCGNIQLESFERFGAGVEVEDANACQRIVELGFDRPWITDHLGVQAIFNVDAQD